MFNIYNTDPFLYYIIVQSICSKICTYPMNIMQQTVCKHLLPYRLLNFSKCVFYLLIVSVVPVQFLIVLFEFLK